MDNGSEDKEAPYYEAAEKAKQPQPEKIKVAAPPPLKPQDEEDYLEAALPRDKQPSVALPAMAGASEDDPSSIAHDKAQSDLAYQVPDQADTATPQQKSLWEKVKGLLH